MKIVLFFLSFICSVQLCVGQGVQYSKTLNPEIDSIIALGKTLIGKPYRSKINQSVLLDCSGFIQYIFKKSGIEVPRTSRSMYSISKEVSLKEAQKGDLLFFKGRNKNNPTIGHVSMVIQNDSTGMKMMHSCHRGVIIDDFPRSYYRERLVAIGRIESLHLSSVEKESFDNERSLGENEIDKNQTDTTVYDHKENENVITIAAVGDIMLGTNFPSKKHLSPQDGAELLTEATPILNKADVAFGNLEGVLLDDGPTTKRCSDPSKCYAFRSPNRYVNHFKNAGFDVLSIANNHIGDFGTKGKENTMKLLSENSIKYAGLVEQPYDTLFKNGVKYGFCAFSPNNGTIKINNYTKAKQIISYLDSICDVVIVSFHGGAEGAKYSHLTKKTEMFLGENRGNPHQFARIVIDAGADLVLGHGPHVPRAIDIYKGKFIAYSMGNFATYSRFNLRGVNGLAPLLEVKIDKKGDFIEGQIHSFVQQGEGGVQKDLLNKSVTQIKKLTEEDLPETQLFISPLGKITKK